ncbi:MAG TPA: mannosyltransferase family protein [Dictyobacter sp.]|jgi:hypothetical protein|nr:mannosyltransferase family protein [Dictyobacter sp.]
MKRIPVRDILWLFIATRLMLVLITYIAYILLTAAKYSTTPVDISALLTTWDHWDAADYTRIAQSGYQHFDLAFFPLFPLLIFCFAHILGGASWSYLVAGTIISNASLFGFLCLLYCLTTEITGDEVAKRALLYICIFPTACFFFAAYNESLYLLFATGTFLCLQRQRWWLAGVLGLLATTTRSAGLLLVVPYLYALWQQRATAFSTIRTWITQVGPIILIPAGMALFALYCWITVGNPLYFITVQAHSGRHLSWPLLGIWQAFSALILYHPQAFGSSNQAHLLFDLSVTLIFIALIGVGWRTLPRQYSIWTIVFMLYILTDPALAKPDVLLSNQRFVLEMFPAFITLALLGKRYPRVHHAIVISFPILLAVFSIAFLMNRWIV